MTDGQAALFGIASSAIIIALFAWYWRSTEWDTKKNRSQRPDRQRYCTRCGTVAEPEYHYAGSILIEIFLLLLFIVPAIFYHFWRRSQEYWGCPECHSREIIRLDSPVAAQRLSAGMHAQ